ncbi:MAG TPA: YfiR family protein [Steroidobacteraceae bacterium]|jgi:hypothetical protein
MALLSAKLRLLLAAGACLIVAHGLNAADAPTENQVQAVFLYNFSRFVEWPPQAFAAATDPFVIGIMGTDPFGARLDEAVRNEQVNGHALTVRRIHSVAELDNCQILFIDRSEIARLGQILAALDHHSTLTVSQAEDAAQRGVMIQFATENSRIRLRINVDSARAAGLTISSKLLRPAEIIGSPDAREEK